MYKKIYKIKARVWIHSGVAVWHFVNIPTSKSKIIKKFFGDLSGGWGSLPVNVTLGKTRWKTSIFPDRKSSQYLLPLKLEIRKKEKIRDGDNVNFLIELRV